MRVLIAPWLPTGIGIEMDLRGPFARSQSLQDLRAGVGHHRQKENRGYSKGLRDVVEHLGEALRLSGVLGQGPGLVWLMNSFVASMSRKAAAAPS